MKRPALVSFPEGFAADAIHDSYHVKQWNYACGGERGKRFERKASEFTAGVLTKLSFSKRELDIYQTDAITGHLCKQAKKKP